MRAMSASAIGKITGLLASRPANCVTASMELNRSSVTNSTSSSPSRTNNSAPAVTLDISPGDARKDFIAQQFLVSLRVFRFRPPTPNTRNHCSLYRQGATAPDRVGISDSITSTSTSTGKKSKTKRKRWSHAHYLIPAIDIDDLARDRGRPVAGEKNSRGA